MEKMVKIQRKLSKKRYLAGKYTYQYERYFIEIPKKYKDKIKPLLNQELKIEVKKVGNKTLIVLTPTKNVSEPRKHPAKFKLNRAP